VDRRARRGRRRRRLPARGLAGGLPGWPPPCCWAWSPCCCRPSRPPARWRLRATPPNGCKTALADPFADFLRRYGKQALLILALIAVYRISDVVMGIMANPFYVDMGYTKDEVAAVTKIYGVVMTLVGAFVGGALAMRFGVMRVLMLGAVLSAASNLLLPGWARAATTSMR
jgi:MFS-type transporter involved in bile tolerance (Atg22 family)